MAKQKKFESDSPSWDEIRKLRQPRHDTVWVPLDSDLMGRIEELERRIRAEQRRDEREHRRPVAPRLQKDLDKLLDEAEEAAVAFKLAELPRKIYRALIDAHPATDADKARGITRWNEDMFAPALIAAVCVAPELTTIPRGEFLDLIPGSPAKVIRGHVGPAVEIWDEWAASIAYMLFGAAYELQEGDSKVPFTVRSSSETPGSAPSSTTAHPEG